MSGADARTKLTGRCRSDTDLHRAHEGGARTCDRGGASTGRSCDVVPQKGSRRVRDRFSCPILRAVECPNVGPRSRFPIAYRGHAQASNSDKRHDSSEDTPSGPSAMRLARALFTHRFASSVATGECRWCSRVLPNSALRRGPARSSPTKQCAHCSCTRTLPPCSTRPRAAARCCAISQPSSTVSNTWTLAPCFLRESPPLAPSATRRTDRGHDVTGNLTALRGRILDAIDAQEIRERARGLCVNLSPASSSRKSCR